MKKIMFNDKYGLTTAVLDGRKTMTRRMVKDGTPLGNWRETEKYAQYKIGEVVAISQSYKDLGYTKEWVEQHIKPNPNAKGTDPFEKQYPGWTNKMFTPAELNKARKIRITDIKVERLQDISDEDCLREGIIDCGVGARHYGFADVQHWQYYFFSREAFAHLIGKVSGKGTWERNPYVFAYSFELFN